MCRTIHVGEAGNGAAISAGVGDVHAALESVGQEPSNSNPPIKAAQMSQMYNEKSRAYAACLQGRGYNVR